MRYRFAGSMITAAIAATALGAVISGSVTRTSAQAPAQKTAWGEPDLQGIWTDESDTPMQRSPRYANQEFFTAEQRAELDRQRSALIGRDRRAQRGTEADVAGAYNAVFTPMKRTGTRTSRVVDPPTAGFRRRRQKLRSWLPPNGNFVLPCCNRPRRARTRSRPVTAASTIRRPRRDSRNSRLATTPRA
jgi:hypothetical protein